MKVRFRIVVADTIVKPLAMMVHTVDTNVTPSAMVVPGWFYISTDETLFDGLILIGCLHVSFLGNFSEGLVCGGLFIEDEVNLKKHDVEHVD